MSTAEWKTSQQLFAEVLVRGDVDVPIAFCTAHGVIQSAAPAVSSLLQRLTTSTLSSRELPAPLWRALDEVPAGETIAWQGGSAAELVVECTRYAVRTGGFALWIRESAKQTTGGHGALNRRQRAGARRLIAGVAHDLRGSVARIVYSADYLEARGADVPPQALRESVAEIYEASRRLQLTVDGLLDYAELGPAISVPVSLHEVLHRAHGLLRSFFREGAGRLSLELARGAEWTRGNPVVIEQIFVNALLSFAELGGASSAVRVHTVAASRAGFIEVHLRSDTLGEQGVESALASSTGELVRAQLLDARVAAESQGGRLEISSREQTLQVVVELARSEGPR